MLNPLNFLSKFIKSSNQKELDKMQKILNKTNSFESEISNLDNSDFPKKTNEFIKKINDGFSLDQIMPEAFALLQKDLITKDTLMCK